MNFQEIQKTKFGNRSAITIIIFILLSLKFIQACEEKRPTPTALPPTGYPASYSTAASSTPTSSAALPPQTLEPTVEPTFTPVPVITPQGSAEDYRLKAWDRSAALRMYIRTDDVPIAEEYANLRLFYKLSLLEEAYLTYPDLRSDPDLLRDEASLKGFGGTYFAYGLLHDHSVEPFRQGLEQALNNGSAKLPDLILWNQKIISERDLSPAAQSNRLFDASTPASVLKISSEFGWNFFVLRKNADNSYTVFALYPEWEQRWWSDETFQITDLNGNGKDEIAITRTAQGTQSTYLCQEIFSPYEWDGKTFRNLVSAPLNFSMNTNDGNCLDVTFQPDTAGRKMFQVGISIITYCDDYPYLEPVTYRWNGKAFKPQAKSDPVPPDSRKPDQCTIGWALAGGLSNDSALILLAAAVADWPPDADELWGPASHDYFKMKLATWYMVRGQMQPGIDLLQQVRDTPTTPGFSMASQVAAAFLETYKTKGIYPAAQMAGSLYETGQKSFCGPAGCALADILDQWGFAEPEWDSVYGGGFLDDFRLMDALSLDLNQNPPQNMETFQNHLIRIGSAPVWSGEANADGQGQPDWLVDLNSTQMLFLRQNDRLTKVELSNISVNSEDQNRMHRWEIIRPDSKAPVVNVYQLGTEIFAFHLVRENGAYQVVMDLNSSDISTDRASAPTQVLNWSIQDGKLIVQYDGSEGVYVWDEATGKLTPTGYAPDRLEANISQAEQAIYVEDDPAQAIEILTNLLKGRIEENYVWESGISCINPPRLRPYIEYLTGLAYERNGDHENAARAYWQLWHDYPANPYSLAAQSKLEAK